MKLFCGFVGITGALSRFEITLNRFYKPFLRDRPRPKNPGAVSPEPRPKHGDSMVGSASRGVCQQWFLGRPSVAVGFGFGVFRSEFLA